MILLLLACSTGADEVVAGLASPNPVVRQDAIEDATEVVLVSDPFHALRIDAIADEVGLDAAVSPTPSSLIGGTDELRNMVRETAGVAVGRLVGFRRLDLWSGNLD